MKRRERLFRWICPEAATMLEQAKRIVREYEEAKDALGIDGKEVNTRKGVVILGDVTGSTVTVAPELHTEVILSKLEFKSLLHLQGEQQAVTNSIFNAHNTEITGILTGAAKEGEDWAKGISSPEPREAACNMREGLNKKIQEREEREEVERIKKEKEASEGVDNPQGDEK